MVVHEEDDAPVEFAPDGARKASKAAMPKISLRDVIISKSDAHYLCGLLDTVKALCELSVPETSEALPEKVMPLVSKIERLTRAWKEERGADNLSVGQHLTNLAGSLYSQNSLAAVFEGQQPAVVLDQQQKD